MRERPKLALSDPNCKVAAFKSSCVANDLQVFAGKALARRTREHAMSLSPVLLRIIGAFAIAFAGGALSALFARTHKQLCAFISLGAGSLLGVALCGIGPEVFRALHWWEFVLGAGSGYLLF